MHYRASKLKTLATMAAVAVPLLGFYGCACEPTETGVAETIITPRANEAADASRTALSRAFRAEANDAANSTRIDVSLDLARRMEKGDTAQVAGDLKRPRG